MTTDRWQMLMLAIGLSFFAIDDVILDHPIRAIVSGAFALAGFVAVVIGNR